LSVLDHYDPVLLARFCVARDFDHDKTLDMIFKDIKWRYFEIYMDEFMEKYPQTEWFKIINNIYPTLTHGFDKYNVEVNWEKVTLLDIDDFFKKVPLSEIILFHIYQVESSERRVKLRMKETGLYRFRRALFEDIKDLSIKNLTTKTIQLLKITAEIDENHFPESLRKLYFINAPSIFSIFLKAINPFLDEGTRKKLKVTGSKCLMKIKSQVPNETYWPNFFRENSKICQYCSKKICIPPGGQIDSNAIPTVNYNSEIADRAVKFVLKKNKNQKKKS
jgi:hypothetical protein